jgi:predicted SpoU family rRNA methylase
MKKRVVIIVPGTRILKKWPNFIQIPANIFINLFKFKVPSLDNTKHLKESIKNKKVKVVVLRWSQGFTRLSKWFAQKKLKNLLRKYKDYEVKIVGVSMAGDIITETLKNVQPKNVKKVILVGSLNSNQKINFKTPKIVNIYSQSDNFIKLATKVLSPITGGQKLIGKEIENIVIPEITHQDFLGKTKIPKGKFKDKTILEVINHFLKI